MTNALLIYSIMLFGCASLVYWGGRCKYILDKNIFLFLAFMVVFLPSALRFDVGTDFTAYINIYENLDDYSSMEPGFYYLNRALSTINAHSQFSIAVFAFLFLWIVFLSFPKKNQSIYIFIILVMLMFISFNGIRQAISLAFSLLFIKKYTEGKLTSSILCIIIGALFHKSIVLLFPILLATYIPLKKETKAYIIPIIMISLIAIANSFSYQLISLLEFITKTLNLKYASYFGHSKHFTSTDINSGLGVLAKLMFSIFTIGTAHYFLKLNAKYWIIILLTFCYSISIILAKEIEIFGRLETIFMIAPISATFILFTSSQKYSIYKFVAVIFLIFITLSFYKTVVDGKNSYTDPKLYPYQTIISQL